MSIFKKILSSAKIDTGLEVKRFPRGQILGFRGIRDNIGTSMIATYTAYQLALSGVNVCYVDFDFSTPNEQLSSNKTQSIITKWNNERENIGMVMNRTTLSSNLMYVGASTTNSILDFLPLKIDGDYITQKETVISTILKELRDKFEILIVDIPSDLRHVEAFKTLGMCDTVFTVCMYDTMCLNKLQKDRAISAGVIEDKLMNTIIHVNDHFFVEPDYKAINPEMNLITSVSRSSSIAADLINKKINKPGAMVNGSNIDEHIYYSGILEIFNYIMGVEE